MSNTIYHIKNILKRSDLLKEFNAILSGVSLERNYKKIFNNVTPITNSLNSKQHKDLRDKTIKKNCCR
ncbi:hypothetical protein OA19_20305 [Vibrio vulnificus]|nr:hypothetical protein OA19_20305 [Vibrio vulnificus]